HNLLAFNQLHMFTWRVHLKDRTPAARLKCSKLAMLPLRPRLGRRNPAGYGGYPRPRFRAIGRDNLPQAAGPYFPDKLWPPPPLGARSPTREPKPRKKPGR